MWIKKFICKYLVHNFVTYTSHKDRFEMAGYDTYD